MTDEIKLPEKLPAYAPRIGCGLGGLNWDDIYPEIKDLNITICDWS